MLPQITLPTVKTGRFAFGQTAVKRKTKPFAQWLPVVTPAYRWEWPHLAYIRQQLTIFERTPNGRMMLFVPPRHGKSEMVTVRYSAWQLEKDPSQRVIIGAYNQTLANKFSRKIRKIARDRIDLNQERTAVEDWETVKGGGLRAVGVGGGITGQGGDLIIIDDPVKNREEANSKTYRDRVYDWYTDDLYTRLEPDAKIILIMTRWHEDDLAGRILASDDADNWQVVTLPALAEDGDPLGREVGVALCPERYDEQALANIRQAITGRTFSALYQQRPQEQEGGMFKRSYFQFMDAADIPDGTNFVWRWDKAATGGGGDYTAGVKMGRTPDGRYIVADVVNEQLSTYERDERVRQILTQDPVSTWIEQEGGSSGKDVVFYHAQLFAGFPVHSETVTGSKLTRAEPFAAQCEAGNVWLVRARWNTDYLDQLATFPTGAHDDMVDASSGAFAKVAQRPALLTSKRYA